MKFFSLNKTAKVNTGDSLGHGMDAVIMLALFLGAGYGLDRSFGTIPVFMIAMTVLGAVGLFLKFKYRYEDRMDELEAERLGKHGQARTTIATTTPTSATGTETESAA